MLPPFPPLGADASSTADDSDTALSAEPPQPTTGEIFRPPAQSPDFENLLVHVTPSPTFAGSGLEVDNYGYAPTGALILNATGNVNNAGVAGGLFTVMASTSFGGMNSGTLSYSLPVDLKNRVGVDLFAMNYTLGEGFSPWGHGVNAGQLAALGVSGSNYAGDAWAAQTFVETPDRRLALKETLFLKEFQDTYSQTSQNDRSLLGGTLDLSGFKPWDTHGLLRSCRHGIRPDQGSGSDPNNPFYKTVAQGLQQLHDGKRASSKWRSPRSGRRCSGAFFSSPSEPASSIHHASGDAGRRFERDGAPYGVSFRERPHCGNLLPDPHRCHEGGDLCLLGFLRCGRGVGTRVPVQRHGSGGRGEFLGTTLVCPRGSRGAGRGFAHAGSGTVPHGHDRRQHRPGGDPHPAVAVRRSPVLKEAFHVRSPL
uniref:ORF423 n=1 Tax=Leptospirillum ferrooxidans TaxID=180 RepID=Q58KF1_9BACT|nr:ORF423 [Leptospirillum ferrooxidans]